MGVATRRRSDAQRDRGGILVLTLVLTVVLSGMVLALAQYVTTGLATSKVTTAQTSALSDATAAVQYGTEQLALDGTAWCATGSLPGDFTPNESSVVLGCTSLSTDVPAIVELVAKTPGFELTAEVEVLDVAKDKETARHPVAVTSWSTPNG